MNQPEKMDAVPDVAGWRDIQDAAFNNIPDFLFVVDAAHCVLECNAAFLKLTGYSREEVIGRSLSGILQVAQPDLWANESKEIFAKGFIESDYTVIDHTGKPVLYRVTRTAFSDQSGAPCAVCLGHDVTAWRREDEALRDVYATSADATLSLAEKIRKILKTATGFLELDCGVAGHIVDDEFVVDFGFSVPGKTEAPATGSRFPLEKSCCENACHAGDICAFANVGKEGVPAHPCYRKFGFGAFVDVPLIVDNALYGTVGFASEEPRDKPFSERQKAFVRLIGQWIGQEITRQNYVERLRQSEERLKQINEELAQFNSVVSHDMQQPLRAVTGFLELLEMSAGDTLDEKSLYYVANAREAAEYMAVMINDMLDYSRSGQQGRVREDINLNELMNNICSAFSFTFEEAGADLRFSDLPTVHYDPVQLERILVNLVENAIKYAGDRKPEVFVSAEDAGTEWIIAVRDNGIGIDEDKREVIFDMFRRLHSNQAIPGTGIGLAICKKMVESNNGRIWVDSKKGEGSTFYFTIPKA